MTVKYCYNAKTGESFSYNVIGSYTDFPRGELMAYEDYLVTGIDNLFQLFSVESEFGECPKCKSVRRSINGKCTFCGGDVFIHSARHTNEV